MKILSRPRRSGGFRKEMRRADQWEQQAGRQYGPRPP